MVDESKHCDNCYNCRFFVSEPPYRPESFGGCLIKGCFVFGTGLCSKGLLRENN